MLGSIAKSILFAFICLIGISVSAQDATFKRFEKTSDLQKFTDKSDMLRLQAKNNRLVPKFDRNGQTARTRFQAIATRLPGARGSSSSSSGGNRWSVSSRFAEMTVSAGFGPILNTNRASIRGNSALKDTFWVNVAESQGEQYNLTVKAKADGMLTIEIENGNGAYFFRFSQQKTGEVFCVELGSDCSFSGSAANFDQFATTFPNYVEQRLGPIFKFAGVGAPPHRYHTVVQEHVLAMLQPDDPARMETFNELLETINVGNYEARQDATKELGDRFSKWQNEIKTSISNSELSAEIRARLKKIYESHVKDVERDYREIATKNKFHRDPKYLVWLLGATQGDDSKSKANRQLIVSALESETEQSFGVDVKQWRHWLGEEPSLEEANDSEETDLLATQGVLDEISENIGHMIRLKLVDGAIQLDREHWGKQYDGKTVVELKKELKDYLNKLNLPEQWLTIGGRYPESTIGYPQLIFETLTEGQQMDLRAQQMRESMSSYQMATRNRSFSGVGMDASLELHTSSNPQMIHLGMMGQQKIAIPKPEYFRFRVDEKAGSSRSIDFRENPEGFLMINVGFDGSRSILRMIQTPQLNADGMGCFIFKVNDNQIDSFAAKDFAEMRTAHPDFMTEQFEPQLKKFGIEIVANTDPDDPN